MAKEEQGKGINMDAAQIDKGGRQFFDHFPGVFSSIGYDLHASHRGSAEDEPVAAKRQQVSELLGALEPGRSKRKQSLGLGNVEPLFEFQRLLQRMYSAVQSSGHGSCIQVTSVSGKAIEPAEQRREYEVKRLRRKLLSKSLNAGQSHHPTLQPTEKPTGDALESDDDFPDTQAFDDVGEILLPMPISTPASSADPDTAFGMRMLLS